MTIENRVTEEMALKLVCPIHAGINKACLASACMAWRWDRPDMEEAETDADDVPPPGDRWRHIANRVEVDPETQRPRKTWCRWQRPGTPVGHCGLAGPAAAR